MAGDITLSRKSQTTAHRPEYRHQRRESCRRGIGLAETPTAETAPVHGAEDVMRINSQSTLPIQARGTIAPERLRWKDEGRLSETLC